MYEPDDILLINKNASINAFEFEFNHMNWEFKNLLIQW